jgi:proline iminopeptidase
MSRRINKLSIVIFIVLFTFDCNGQQSGFALSSDSTRIFYKTFGSGIPLLIINGGPGMNCEGFESLAIKLSENYRTIIYDQRGTGRSLLNSIDTSTIKMSLMLDDIEAIRKHLNIRNWSILGHSFGGMVASYYATQYPDNIDKIILSSSGGIDLGLLSYVQASINSKLSRDDLDSVYYWSKKITDGDTSHFARLERGRHLAPAYVIDKKYIPAIAERLTQGNSAINQLIWTDMQLINFDCTEKLKTFDKPVLIIQGKEDIIKAETAEKAHQAFTNSKVVYMEHCIHYGWLDNEAVYFGEIHSFLADAITE